jgi:hypothetical protein
MTCGQYQIYPTSELGGHASMKFDRNVDNANAYRNAPFPYSHLRTYKKFLLDKVNREDLINPETNELYTSAWDFALFMPMVEMAGMDRIYQVDDILYTLNRHSELQHEGNKFPVEQKRSDALIRKGRVYDRL